MEHKFKCKDEVLFRYSLEGDSDDKWTYGVFSHETEEASVLSGNCNLIHGFYDIIPFSGNEHLVGTTDEPGEEFSVNEGDKVNL